MSTTELPIPAVAGERSGIWSLARLEAVRYARHPLFLVGLLFGVLAGAGERGPIELDFQVIPAFFIGVFGIVVAARLTRSTDRSRPIVDAAPAPETKRTAALCLACAVPAGAGLALVVLHRAFVFAEPFPDWMYGTWGPVDRFIITMVIPVIACAGGPLLGVAVGRWLRFPGASLLAVIFVVEWSQIAACQSEHDLDSATLIARTLHMATPRTAFGTGSGEVTEWVRTYTGLPAQRLDAAPLAVGNTTCGRESVHGSNTRAQGPQQTTGPARDVRGHARAGPGRIRQMVGREPRRRPR